VVSAARAGVRRLPLGLDWTRREALVPYAFLLPSFVALGVVFFYPMLRAVVLSFHANAYGAALGPFVGLSQYTAVLASPWFPRVLTTSILWTVGNVVFVLAIGMATALMLDRRFPARSVVRTCGPPAGSAARLVRPSARCGRSGSAEAAADGWTDPAAVASDGCDRCPGSCLALLAPPPLR